MGFSRGIFPGPAESRGGLSADQPLSIQQQQQQQQQQRELRAAISEEETVSNDGDQRPFTGMQHDSAYPWIAQSWQGERAILEFYQQIFLDTTTPVLSTTSYFLHYTFQAFINRLEHPAPVLELLPIQQVHAHPHKCIVYTFH